MSTSDSLLGIPFLDFQGGFTPWDCQEPLFAFQQEELSKPQELVISNPGSQNPKPVTSDSGSDDPNQTASIVDERKTRRMISNRLSARRSRMRKQKQLENLRNQVNRLRMGNRDLMSRLNLVMQHCQLVHRDNEQLRLESVRLREKLWNIRQVLLVRQLQHFSSSAWPCNTTLTSINEPIIPPSLIT